MSGGAYGYAYNKVRDMATQLADQEDAYGDPVTPDENTTSRLKLSGLLDRVADVMRAVEWADSGDDPWTDALRAEIARLAGAKRDELAAHHAKIVAAWKGMLGSEPDESPEGRPCMCETEHGDWIHRVDFADKLATLNPNGGA